MCGATARTQAVRAPRQSRGGCLLHCTGQGGRVKRVADLMSGRLMMLGVWFAWVATAGAHHSRHTYQDPGGQQRSAVVMHFTCASQRASKIRRAAKDSSQELEARRCYSCAFDTGAASVSNPTGPASDGAFLRGFGVSRRCVSRLSGRLDCSPAFSCCAFDASQPQQPRGGADLQADVQAFDRTDMTKAESALGQPDRQCARTVCAVILFAGISAHVRCELLPNKLIYHWCMVAELGSNTSGYEVQWDHHLP